MDWIDWKSVKPLTNAECYRVIREIKAKLKKGDQMDNDLKTPRLHPDQVFDREKWRSQSKRVDPASERDKG